MAVQRLSFLSVQLGLVLAGTTLLSAQLNEAQSKVAWLIHTIVATNVVTSTKTNSAYYRAEALVPGNRAHFACGCASRILPPSRCLLPK
jgi:hypothetical protein